MTDERRDHRAREIVCHGKAIRAPRTLLPQTSPLKDLVLGKEYSRGHKALGEPLIALVHPWPDGSCLLGSPGGGHFDPCECANLKY